GELCCGTCYCPAGGRVKESEEKARELVKNLGGFSPKRVILLCTGCYRQFTELYPKFLELDFEVQHYTRFLGENLFRVDLAQLPGRIIVHASCMPRRTRAYEWARELLQRIPGLEVVKEEALCCGGVANMAYPEMGQRLGSALAEAIAGAEADYAVSVCPFCSLTLHAHLRKNASRLKGIASLMNRAARGEEYPNRLAEYWGCESLGEVMDKSREYLEASGLSTQETRQLLAAVFGALG
ncbi:MAG: (Fe-S)-binding protein, partial [Anaerolineae bacterium]